ncbi:MAG: hypothetical protein SNJ59_14405 [Aggregatilineales bacterium]
MGILGFLAGALLVILIRALQSLDPVWEPGIGIVAGTLFSAIFFVWGIGAFDPRLSVHGEEEAEAHHEEEAQVEAPRELFSSTMWLIVTLSVAALLVIFAFALIPGGFALTVTDDPHGSRSAVGFFTIELPGGTVLEVSELAAFVGFIIFTFLSLAIAAAIFSRLLFSLSRGIAEVQAESKAPALPAGGGAALTAGTAAAEPSAAEAAARSPLLGQLATVLKFVIVFAILYPIFYFVAIGLVLPQEPLLTILSLINAVIFTFLILRPNDVLRAIGVIAGHIANFLRWLPKMLFQR